VSVALVIRHAKCMRRIILFLRPVLPCHIFPHYFINGSFFRKKKKLLKITQVFWFSLQRLSQTSLILRRVQWRIINAHRSSCKVPVILVTFYWNLNFLSIFSKHAQISNILKIRSGGAESFNPNRRTDRCRFSQFCERAWQYRPIEDLSGLNLGFCSSTGTNSKYP
jgi:hypothetical protein